MLGMDLRLGMGEVRRRSGRSITRPSYVSLSFTTASANLNQTVTPALQTVGEGDLLVIAGLMRGDAGDGVMVVNTPGWTAFPGNTYGGATKIRFGMFWKIGTAAESASTVSLTFTGTGVNTVIRPRAARFSSPTGFHATPIGSINVLTGLATPADHQAITGDAEGELAVCFTGFSLAVAAFGAWTGGAGIWTESNLGSTATGGTAAMSVQNAPVANGVSLDDDAKEFTPDAAWTSVSFRIRAA